MQHHPGNFRAVRGVGSAFAVIAVIAVVIQWAAVVLRWIGYRTVAARYEGEISSSDYKWARDTLFPIEVGLWLMSFLAMLVAWIIVTVWLSRARANADTFTDATHRLSPPWAFWGWVVPVVSLWFPAVFVDDLDKVSAPRRRSRGLIASWWITWVLAWITFWAGIVSLRMPDDHDTIQTMRDHEVDGLLIFSASRSASALLFTAAAGCLIVGIVRIGRAQAGWSDAAS
ncbi:DUF4328 domain-containing protein [Nocardia sp. NPDC056541]|uniref:DUF4328 domain-containing protein n=1 Tax=Nocardia sp. NPDC056541 TaxID=3345860 RepID=UPI00366ABB54